MPKLTPQQLLPMIEEVLRTMPPWPGIREDSTETSAWLGQALAVSEHWHGGIAAALAVNVPTIQSSAVTMGHSSYSRTATALHAIVHLIRMETTGPLTMAVAAGSVFDYFDEVRKIVEGAKADLFFIDPYLDPDFVSRYLPSVTPGVTVRLLARAYIAKLQPAASLLATQLGFPLKIRSATNFHDRYVFVDDAACYQSGASFKDAAKKAPTTLTQITDAFPAMRTTYEDIWSAATVVL